MCNFVLFRNENGPSRPARPRRAGECFATWAGCGEALLNPFRSELGGRRRVCSTTPAVLKSGQDYLAAFFFVAFFLAAFFFAFLAMSDTPRANPELVSSPSSPHTRRSREVIPLIYRNFHAYDLSR